MPDPIQLTVQGDESVTLSPEELRVINAVSPEATVEQNADGAEIIIKDLAHGTTRAQIYNGHDGVSPTVTTEQIVGGAVITITDLDGTHTVSLYDGADGCGIANAVLNDNYTLTITYTDGTSYTTPSIRGADGKGIVSIIKTSTSGLVDTYTITYTDGTTATFTVTNGQDGDNGVSPTVLIESITGGHRITITDKEHPSGQSFDVMDGQDGNDGRGIVSVAKTGTSGLNDIYTITYTSGEPTTFTVTNGAPGTPGTDGTNAYVWIRYAAQQPTQDSDMRTTPGPWMGVYSGSSATAPEHYTDYTWNKIKGDMPSVPVQDVQVNGTSILNNGVANVPKATNSALGVTQYALSSDCKTGTGTARSITPSLQHSSTFFGLAKAAGDSTQSASSNAVGTYTDEAKGKIQAMLGTSPQNGIVQNGSIADQFIDSGKFVVWNGSLYRASANIAQGEALSSNSLDAVPEGGFNAILPMIGSENFTLISEVTTTEELTSIEIPFTNPLKKICANVTIPSNGAASQTVRLGAWELTPISTTPTYTLGYCSELNMSQYGVVGSFIGMIIGGRHFGFGATSVYSQSNGAKYTIRPDMIGAKEATNYARIKLWGLTMPAGTNVKIYGIEA